MGCGYWVEIRAHRIPATLHRPHGVDYSLCLFNPHGERLICYDNAHAIAVGSGPATRHTEQFDHWHKGERVRPYTYTSAETLLDAFWNDVYTKLKEEGVP